MSWAIALLPDMPSWHGLGQLHVYLFNFWYLQFHELKTRPYNIKHTVYSQLSGIMVDRGCADNWDTQLIQNIYFVEPQTNK
jgi:hypothetical protein